MAIQKRFRKHEWILVCESRKKNTLADIVAKHTVEYEMPLFCDEFFVGSIHRVCFDIVLKEQLYVWLFFGCLLV